MTGAISVAGFNISGMPARIDSASVTRALAIPEVSLIISKLSGERVMNFSLMLFIFDSHGNLKAKEDFPEKVDFSFSPSINISYLPLGINLLSRDTEPSVVKKIFGARVNILSPDEVKAKANREGEIYYFEFTYLNFEGATAQVAIAYEYRVRERTNHSPCCGYVTLKLSKETGNWRIIEAAIAGR